MEEPSPSLSGYRFGVFEVDLRAGEIRKNGLKIKLQEQPFQVLTILLQHSPNMVAREDLRKRLWDANTFVEFDHSLSNAIGRIRQALGDSADNARFIETLPKRGYRLIVPVEKLIAFLVSPAPIDRAKRNGSHSEGLGREIDDPQTRGDSQPIAVEIASQPPSRLSRDVAVLFGVTLLVFVSGFVFWFESSGDHPSG